MKDDAVTFDDDELRKQAVYKLRRQRGFRTHVLVYLLTNAFISLIWFFTDRRWQGVLWTVTLTAGVGTRLGLVAAASHEGVLGLVGSMAIALVFSIALGLWVTQIAEQSEVHRQLVAQLQAA